MTAADSDFNGRWNIEVEREPKNRAWWLEVSGAGGSGTLTGRFVGFPGGDMKPIAEMSIKDGVLHFADRRGKNLEYEARLKGGKLVGVRKDGAEVLNWTGIRAPGIKDKDDGSWTAGQPVALFNLKDLSGWKPQVGSEIKGWTVHDGVMANVAGASDLVSKEKFWNFELIAEYRIGEGSNSGIGLRGRYEVQILQDYGKPQDTHSHGALYSRIKPAVNASRPPGEWNEMKIRLVGRILTAVLNGKTVLDKVEVEGLTAMASNPNEADPGPLTIQGDHREVEFRKLVVTPLVKK